MTNHTANAAALGYGAFALTLWLTGMLHAGWFDGHADNMLVPVVVAALGGSVVALAGVLQWLRGHTLDATLFLSFAAYWWINALYRHALAGAVLDTGAAPAGYLGWYQFAWAFLAFCLWVAACRGGAARMLFSLGVWLSLLAAAIADWIGMDAIGVLGGYLQLITAVVGIYILAAAVINEASGHRVLPLGVDAAPPPEHAGP